MRKRSWAHTLQQDTQGIQKLFIGEERVARLFGKFQVDEDNLAAQESALDISSPCELGSGRCGDHRPNFFKEGTELCLQRPSNVRRLKCGSCCEDGRLGFPGLEPMNLNDGEASERFAASQRCGLVDAVWEMRKVRRGLWPLFWGKACRAVAVTAVKKRCSASRLFKEFRDNLRHKGQTKGGSTIILPGGDLVQILTPLRSLSS